MRSIEAAGFEARSVPDKLGSSDGAALAAADALVVISAAAGGAGGVEPAALPALMAAVPASITRLVYLSVHGVERTGKMPFSMQNLFGQVRELTGTWRLPRVPPRLSTHACSSRELTARFPDSCGGA